MPEFMHIRYDIVSDIKPGGAFLLNCAWDLQGLEENLPAAVKRQIAEKKIRFYTLDATGIAQKMGLNSRIDRKKSVRRSTEHCHALCRERRR